MNGYRFVYLLSNQSEVEVELRGASYSEAAKRARQLATSEADVVDELIDKMICCEHDPEIKRTNVTYVPGLVEESA